MSASDDPTIYNLPAPFPLALFLRHVRASTSRALFIKKWWCCPIKCNAWKSHFVAFQVKVNSHDIRYLLTWICSIVLGPILCQTSLLQLFFVCQNWGQALCPSYILLRQKPASLSLLCFSTNNIHNDKQTGFCRHTILLLLHNNQTLKHSKTHHSNLLSF